MKKYIKVKEYEYFSKEICSKCHLVILNAAENIQHNDNTTLNYELSLQ